VGPRAWGETFKDIEAREDGLEGWLSILATDRREERYRPQAVRWAMIPKPDGGVDKRHTTL
jgi:retron-type reverse transcriptase